MMTNSKDIGDVNTVTNSGSIGAIAIGRGAVAVQAGGNVQIDTAALDAQLIALEKLIEQNEDSVKLKGMLKEAIEKTRSENPEHSKPIWNEMILSGGAIATMVNNILSLLFP